MTKKPNAEVEALRSTFVRRLILEQAERIIGEERLHFDSGENAIPRKILQYWHDLSDLPTDVRECMASWEQLAEKGFEFFLHDDVSAAEYIARKYGKREQDAFARCAHPAMRSDYLRLCFIVEEGGLYVDSDDVLIGEGWSQLFVSASWAPRAFQLDGWKFQGRSSSIRFSGWPSAMASSVALR